MLTPDYKAILRNVLLSILFIAFCGVCVYFLASRGCSEKKTQSPIVVLRDSVDQKLIDSLQNANAVLSFNQEELKKSIESIRRQQVFRKIQIKKDYEIIQKSDADSVYNDVIRYLRDWKPEE